MPEGSRRLASLMLEDSVTVMEKENKQSGAEILYTSEEIKMILNFIIGADFNKEYKIYTTREFDPSFVNIEFFEAGHIFGSGSVFIRGNGKKVYYTGDVCFHNQNILKKGNLPREPVDVLILEGTYGHSADYGKSSRRKEIKSFGKKLRTVLERDGSVLIPAFALGRTQEVIAIISELMSEKRIPLVPVYYGGMGTEISEIYDNSDGVCSKTKPDFKISDLSLRKYNRNSVRKGNYMMFPSIVIAPSGMMIPNTPAFKLAEPFLTNPKNGVFFVGYCDPDTPSYTVSNAQKGDVIELNSESQSLLIKSDVEKFDFSAHAYGKELINVVDTLDPEKTILVHGDIESLLKLKTLIKEIHPEKEVIIPEIGIKYFLN
jgi:Cft2 family RNA processing exonuclease